MLPKIIGLVGPIRAGKTTIGSYLARCYGYRPASNSDLLKSIARGLDLPIDRSNLKRLGDAIFNVLGNETLARYRIDNSADFPIVVDGIRYLEEVYTYSNIPSFRLIAINSDDNVRYERAMAFGNSEKDSHMTPGDFVALSDARSERSIPELMKMAHLCIENNGDLRALESSIDAAMLAWADIDE